MQKVLSFFARLAVEKLKEMHFKDVSHEKLTILLRPFFLLEYTLIPVLSGSYPRSEALNDQLEPLFADLAAVVETTEFKKAAENESTFAAMKRLYGLLLLYMKSNGANEKHELHGLKLLHESAQSDKMNAII